MKSQSKGTRVGGRAVQIPGKERAGLRGSKEKEVNTSVLFCLSPNLLHSNSSGNPYQVKLNLTGIRLGTQAGEATVDTSPLVSMSVSRSQAFWQVG